MRDVSYPTPTTPRRATPNRLPSGTADRRESVYLVLPTAAAVDPVRRLAACASLRHSQFLLSPAHDRHPTNVGAFVFSPSCSGGRRIFAARGRTRTLAAHAGSEAPAEGGTNFCACWYSTPARCSPTSSANCGDDPTEAQYLASVGGNLGRRSRPIPSVRPIF